MTKQELVRNMERHTGHSFINTSQIATFLGKSRDYVRNCIVCDLDCIGSSRNKQYFVGDVAERIMQNRTA